MTDTWLGLLHALTGRMLESRQARRDPAGLIEELAAEGYDPEDVALAAAWIERFFAGLHQDAAGAGAPEPIASSGHRTRSAEELLCLTPEAFGLLLRLERAGVIDPAAREQILERALELGDEEVGEELIREISRGVLEAAGRDASGADAPETRPRARLH